MAEWSVVVQGELVDGEEPKVGEPYGLVLEEVIDKRGSHTLRFKLRRLRAG